MNDKKNEMQKSKEKRNVNTCRLCGKKLVSKDNNFAQALITKDGHCICLLCAYAIEEALEMAEFGMELSDFIEKNSTLNVEVSQRNVDNVDNDKIKKDTLPNRGKIINTMKKAIIGQDKSIVKLVTRVYRNYLSDNKELKTAPLLIGKSGQGKTIMVKQLCKLLEIPYVIENAKDFSEAGYVGREPMEIFTDLYNMCGKDAKLTSNGVIIIDEIDKLKATNDIKDVSGSGVIDTFLSYLSGTKVPIKDKYGSIIDYITTDNITFIFMGAFEDEDLNNSLYAIREKRLSGNKSIGFSGSSEKKSDKSTLKMFVADDLIKYGFSRQFIGRVSIIELNELGRDEYLNVMLKSTISTYKAYRREFKSYGITVTCTKQVLEKIVDIAILKNTGVRGLISACEDVFNPPLEEIECTDNVNYTNLTFTLNNDEIIYKLK